jgi:7-keto-8-aminopelargonate synthetase-like enzyme
MNQKFFEMCPAFALKLREEGVYSDPFTAIGSSLGTKIQIKGVDGIVTSWTSLGYLGDFTDIMAEAAARNIRKYGTGLASSRIIMDTDIHQKLEKTLADFKEVPAGWGSVLTNTGYGANTVFVSLLLKDLFVAHKKMKGKPETLLIMDEYTHASVIEAIAHCKTIKNSSMNIDFEKIKKELECLCIAGNFTSSSATEAIKKATASKREISINFPHLEYDKLEEILFEHSGGDKELVIATDSLFSMNGDKADIPRLYKLAKKYGALIYLDNAHSDWVYGEQGRGYLHLKDTIALDRSIFVQTGTLSKAVSGLGGFITLPKSLCELARFSQWSYIFSVGLPTFLVATMIDIIDMIRGPEGDRRRKILHKNSAELLNSLKENGFDTQDSCSHIVPVVIGKGPKCLEVQRYLLTKHNILPGAVRFPAVKRNQAILRLPVSSDHSSADIDKLVFSLKDARDRFDF